MMAKLTHITKFNSLILSVLCFSLLAIIALSCYYTTTGSFQPSAINVADSLACLAAKQSCKKFRGNWVLYFKRLLTNDINVSIYHEHEAGLPLRSPTIGTNSWTGKESKKRCDMSRGNWIPFPEGPYYTNETKCAMDHRQNCMKSGRPDTAYLKWRWRPDECELPLFDADQFLELVRGKSMAFIGDSLARNQMQSLICLLTKVRQPLDISNTRGISQRWFYNDYNFTLAHLWTTHLIRIQDVNIYTKNPSNLTLDVADESWASNIEDFDYVIVSSGHWFMRPLTYYEKGRYLGCHQCEKDQATDVKMPYAFRMAYRTTFRKILDHAKFKGTIILRTITQSHEDCARTRSFQKQELELDSLTRELLTIQMEELNGVEREGEKRGLKFRSLNITEPMAMRPDGHPNSGEYWPHERLQRPDCLHWCLPGPVDLWNEILLETMKIESK